MTLQQPPPPSIVERSSISNCTSGKGLESHCRTLMVLAEATSQFVESSRGDGEVPGFSEVSLSAQKLQEDIKRFIEHHQKETQHSNININMAQFPTNTELYTSSCTSSVQTCEVSTSTMSSKNGNFFPTSTYEEQDISNTTAIQSCAEQRSVKVRSFILIFVSGNFSKNDVHQVCYMQGLKYWNVIITSVVVNANEIFRH